MIFAAMAVGPSLLYNDIHTAPFHPQIHNMGNTGMGGALHARLACSATRVIDHIAYDGRNMRRELAESIAKTRPNGLVVDVGCGVGTLTRELIRANLTVVGAIDASPQMITQAEREVPGQTFTVLNAAALPEQFSGIDIAVACMLVHELPQNAHADLILAMLNATHADGEVWVADIDPSYIPSPMMLTGEPYVQEYIRTFEGTLRRIASMENSLHLQIDTLIENRVTLYRILKNVSISSKKQNVPRHR